MNNSIMAERQIRAFYDDKIIRVYQAFSHEIANAALSHGSFISPPFKMSRMTWIKPSFLWMMFRSGWATKPGQERVLAIDITRDGFEWALDHAVLSNYHPHLHESKELWQKQIQNTSVRVQWDPDKDIHLRNMNRRAIQIGLIGEAVRLYVEKWISKITDITTSVHALHKEMCEGNQIDISKLPSERLYLCRHNLKHLLL